MNPTKLDKDIAATKSYLLAKPGYENMMHRLMKTAEDRLIHMIRTKDLSNLATETESIREMFSTEVEDYADYGIISINMDLDYLIPFDEIINSGILNGIPDNLKQGFLDLDYAGMSHLPLCKLYLGDYSFYQGKPLSTQLTYTVGSFYTYILDNLTTGRDAVKEGIDLFKNTQAGEGYWWDAWRYKHNIFHFKDKVDSTVTESEKIVAGVEENIEHWKHKQAVLTEFMMLTERRIYRDLLVQIKDDYAKMFGLSFQLIN